MGAVAASSRYPPAGIQVPAAVTGRARDAAGQEPHLSRRDPGSFVFRGGALQAHPLVRLVDQRVRDRAEPERLLLPVLAAPIGGWTEAGVLPERRREVAERLLNPTR